MALDRQIAVLVNDEAFILPVADFISAWGIRASLRGETSNRCRDIRFWTSCNWE